jgi:hypothetical protein
MAAVNRDAQPLTVRLGGSLALLIGLAVALLPAPFLFLGAPGEDLNFARLGFAAVVGGAAGWAIGRLVAGSPR